LSPNILSFAFRQLTTFFLPNYHTTTLSACRTKTQHTNKTKATQQPSKCFDQWLTSLSSPRASPTRQRDGFTPRDPGSNLIDPMTPPRRQVNRATRREFFSLFFFFFFPLEDDTDITNQDTQSSLPWSSASVATTVWWWAAPGPPCRITRAAPACLGPRRRARGRTSRPGAASTLTTRNKKVFASGVEWSKRKRGLIKDPGERSACLEV